MGSLYPVRGLKVMLLLHCVTLVILAMNSTQGVEGVLHYIVQFLSLSPGCRQWVTYRVFFPFLLVHLFCCLLRWFYCCQLLYVNFFTDPVCNKDVHKHLGDTFSCSTIHECVYL